MKRFFTLLAALLLVCTADALAQEYVATPVTVSREKVRLNGKIYLSHVVLERQTLFGISQAYGVSVDELYEANPLLKEKGLQKNSILLVPYKEQAAATIAPDTQEPQAYTEHIVRWYEDIDDVAHKYNVSVKEIMDYNGLTSRKLTTRQVLKIPLKGNAATETAKSQVDTAATLPVEEPADTLLPEEPAEPEVVVFVPTPKEQVSFSLILPMQQSGQTFDMYMDFYSGVLMALKDFDAEGTKVQAHIYDLSAGIPSADLLAKDDFVLGPIAPKEVEAILQRVDGRVPVVSPLDPKAATLGTRYSNFVQAPAAAEKQYEDLCAWVKQDLRSRDRILLITEKGAGNVTASVAIRSALAQEELPYEILNYAIVEGRGIPTTLAGQLTKDGINRVIVATESEAFMGDVVRNIGIMLGKGYNVVLYAPSKTRTFDTIDGSAYHEASLHISTAYFADYADQRVNRFVKAYRALFQTEPSQFAFQGYDTARHFIMACSRFGDHWQKAAGTWRSSGLHTDILLEKTEEGNLRNSAVRRIVYNPDYTTSLER